MADSRIFRENNRLYFQGTFGIADLHRSLDNLNGIVQQAGYPDVILDFSSCDIAYPSAMLGLCAQVSRMHLAQIDFELILPNKEELRRLFYNANWAHFLAPRANDPSVFKGHKQVPATQYSKSEDQFKAVNRIANAILGAIPDIAREDFAALEWSINEITDNVMVHAQSPVGGFVQVSTFSRTKKRLAFIVADAGVGIPVTLRKGYPEISSDADALDKAIREGVTRDTSIGQGNGLFGSYQICSHSGGYFQMDSGYAKLIFSQKAGLHVRAEPVPYDGTLVVAEIDFSVPRLLEEALKFGGRVHHPTDYVTARYEDNESDRIRFRIADEATAFGSRIAGTPVRNKLLNLEKMCPKQRIWIDFEDVALISSSFADEVVGKLFAEFGPMRFMGRFQLTGASSTVQSLIDRAISQRMSLNQSP